MNYNWGEIKEEKMNVGDSRVFKGTYFVYADLLSFLEMQNFSNTTRCDLGSPQCCRTGAGPCIELLEQLTKCHQE